MSCENFLTIGSKRFKAYSWRVSEADRRIHIVDLSPIRVWMINDLDSGSKSSTLSANQP